VHFGFTDEQLSVRDAAGLLLGDGCDRAALQRVWDEGHARSMTGLWRDLAAMGVQGMAAPTHAGGSGLDTVSLALVLAETGRVALPLPVAETAAVGVPLLRDADDPAGVLAGLVDGSLALSACSGDLAPFSTDADLFLLSRDSGVVLYERGAVTVERVVSVDRTRDLGRVTANGRGVVVAEGADGRETAGDLAALAAAAQLVGLGRRMVSMTVDYVKDRHQFEAPVGSFQAVKHHLADATMHMELAAPAVWAAAYAVDSDSPERAAAVSVAKAAASDAATLAGRVALQCHGAMGYSCEYPLHMWMKRAWCLAAAHGTAAWHRDRIGRLLRLPR
jgi:alkylation response protein AidB-like acyl-CoA dehydrogenase